MLVDQYDPLFSAAGSAYNVDPRLLKALAQVESSGRAKAISSAGALGLTQIMPETAAGLGLRDPKLLFEPSVSVPMTANMLSQYLRQGDTPEALRMYFGGEDRSKWGPKTAAYPGKVLQAYNQVAAPSGAPAAAEDNLPPELLARHKAMMEPADTISPGPAETPIDDQLLARHKLLLQEPTPATISTQPTAGYPTLPPGTPAEPGLGSLPGTQGKTPALPGAPAQPGNDPLNVGGPGFVRGMAEGAYLGALPPTPDQVQWEQNHPVYSGLAQTLGSLPALVAGPEAAIGLTAKALPAGVGAFIKGSGGLLSKATHGALLGAGAGAEGSQLNPDVPVGKQALFGGAAGAVLGPAANALSNYIIPPARKVSQHILDKIQGLEDAGIKVAPSQIDPALAKAEAAGGGFDYEAQQHMLTRRTAETIGLNTDTLSDKELSAAATQYGTQMSNAIDNNHAVVNFDQRFFTEITKLRHDFMAEAGTISKPGIEALDDVWDRINKRTFNGAMDGQSYKNFTDWGGDLSKLQRDGEGRVKYFASQLREIIDNGLERSSSPGTLADIQSARAGFKRVYALEDALTPHGLIDPKKLSSAAAKWNLPDTDPLGQLGNNASVISNVKITPAGTVKTAGPGLSGHAENWAAYTGASIEAMDALHGDYGARGLALMAPKILHAARGKFLGSDFYRNMLLDQIAKGGGAFPLNKALANALTVAPTPTGTASGVGNMLTQ